MRRHQLLEPLFRLRGLLLSPVSTRQKPSPAHVIVLDRFLGVGNGAGVIGLMKPENAILDYQFRNTLDSQRLVQSGSHLFGFAGT